MIPVADRELTLDAFGRRHPNTELQHGGLRNVCVGTGSYVFLCRACQRWTCECKGSAPSDIDGDAGDLCDDCWVSAFGKEQV